MGHSQPLKPQTSFQSFCKCNVDQALVFLTVDSMCPHNSPHVLEPVASRALGAETARRVPARVTLSVMYVHLCSAAKVP